MCSEREDKQTQNAPRHAKIVNAFVHLFLRVIGKNPKTLKLSPMADEAITRGGIGSLGSLVPLYLSFQAYLPHHQSFHQHSSIHSLTSFVFPQWCLCFKPAGGLPPDTWGGIAWPRLSSETSRRNIKHDFVHIKNKFT